MNGMRPTSAPLLAAVHALIADIDRDSSVAHRLQTREMFLRFWEMNDSLEGIHQVANEMLALLQHAPDGSLKPNDVRRWYGSAYADLMTVAFFTHPDSMLPLAKRAQQDTPEIWLAFKGASNLRALSAHEVVSLLAPIGTAWDLQQRRRMPPLGKTVWYPTGSDMARPIPGQMTMFVVGGGVSMASRIRHWLAQPGARGLHVTIMEGIDDTAAYWAPADFGLLQGPLTQSEREERARWYYLDYERLPVTVAMQARHVELQSGSNPLRAVVTPAPFELIMNKEKGIRPSDRALCPGAQPGCVILTDRDGNVLWDGNVLENMGWHESQIDRIVAWAAAQPVTSTPTPVSVSPLN